jgi:hypothetical protein
MSFNHKIISSYQDDAGPVFAATDAYTGNSEVGYDGSVPATTDNQEVDIGFTQSEVKALSLFSTTALTVKTNSSSAPTQTIVLAANQALVWGLNHVEANPITANVTKFFLSNDTAGAAVVKIRVLIT